jgi:ribonuclease P protein component
LVLQAREAEGGISGKEPAIRVGFTVSRKVGNAVARNRARRRLRAAAERIMPVHAKTGHDFVLVGRVATLERPFTALVVDLETALRRVRAYRETDGGEGFSRAERVETR